MNSKKADVLISQKHRLFTFILSSTQTALFCYYRMYSTFAYTKFFRCLAYCCIFFNDIIRNIYCSFFYVSFQKNSLLHAFFTVYEGIVKFMTMDSLKFVIISLFSNFIIWLPSLLYDFNLNYIPLPIETNNR